MVRVEDKANGEVLGTYAFKPEPAREMLDSIDHNIAVAATAGISMLMLDFDGKNGWQFEIGEAAQFVNGFRQFLKVGLEGDMGPSIREKGDRPMSPDEEKMCQDFIEPYYRRGADATLALRDLLLERAHVVGNNLPDRGLPKDPKPGVKITSNTRASWAIRLLQEALDNATAPEQWVGIWRSSVRQAIEAAEREQRGWPLLLRLLADEAYRNGYSAALKREKTGEFNTTGDIEVLIARAAAQVKP